VTWLVKPKLSGSVLTCRLQYAKAMFERNQVGPGSCATLWNPFHNLVNCHESSYQNSYTVWLTASGKCCPRIFSVGCKFKQRSNHHIRILLLSNHHTRISSLQNSDMIRTEFKVKLWIIPETGLCLKSGWVHSTLPMPFFCQQWNCCLCWQQTQLKLALGVSKSQILWPKVGEFCDQDAFWLKKKS
jgi:hypothetical protein